MCSGHISLYHTFTTRVVKQGVSVCSEPPNIDDQYYAVICFALLEHNRIKKEYFVKLHPLVRSKAVLSNTAELAIIANRHFAGGGCFGDGTDCDSHHLAVSILPRQTMTMLYKLAMDFDFFISKNQTRIYIYGI